MRATEAGAYWGPNTDTEIENEKLSYSSTQDNFELSKHYESIVKVDKKYGELCALH